MSEARSSYIRRFCKSAINTLTETYRANSTLQRLGLMPENWAFQIPQTAGNRTQNHKLISPILLLTCVSYQYHFDVNPARLAVWEKHLVSQTKNVAENRTLKRTDEVTIVFRLSCLSSQQQYRKKTFDQFLNCVNHSTQQLDFGMKAL